MSEAEGPRAIGERVRKELRAYRRAYGSAARALAARRREGGDPRADFDALREDWERTVAEFRAAADRIGTLQKTLARDP